jgi:hypothetical protein
MGACLLTQITQGGINRRLNVTGSNKSFIIEKIESSIAILNRRVGLRRHSCGELASATHRPT